jgi:Protein of unknown function (DUF2950)
MNRNAIMHTPVFRTALILLMALGLGACSKTNDAAKGFDTPEAAATALIEALKKDDVDSLKGLLGPGSDSIVSSGDEVADKNGRAEFVAAYTAKHSFEDAGEGLKTLVIGENDWPVPVPLRQTDGKWIFDGAAGAEEYAMRRIGRNELGAIAVSRGFVEAQEEYAAVGHDGDEAGIYALKLMSDPGMQNGLYWQTAEGEEPSPAGEFVASAAEQGYSAKARSPYHGYYYRLLYNQGANAKGGARDYFKDGLLTEGFALVAWPAEYGSGGIQTFIINQDGTVFQKDLGKDTPTAVEAINSFDPDSTWTAVEETAEEAAVDTAAETES